MKHDPNKPIGGLKFQVSERVLARWTPGLRATADTPRSIDMYEAIGQDWTGEGVTASQVAGALRSMGPGPVTVSLNSPGGDMFEGLAIYNLLREHDGQVTVQVIGMAASAASIIAMAGDNVQVARAGFLMIHNAWVFVAGNRLDMAEAAEWLAPFDRSMADIYAARTGKPVSEIAALMDAETWIGGAEAVEAGFADALLPADQIEQGATAATASAVRRLETALRQTLPRSEAMRLISEYRSAMAPEDDADELLTEAAEMARELNQWLTRRH